MKIGKKEYKLLHEIWIAIGAILLSAIGSALWTFVQTGSINMGDFLITSTRIPVSTLILSAVIMVLFLNSYLKIKKNKSELEKSVFLINDEHKNEIERKEVYVEKLRGEIEILQQKIDQYESVEQNVMTVLEERGHASIEEICNAVQAINRNISGEQILNAISHLQSPPNSKIRGYSSGGLTKK